MEPLGEYLSPGPFFEQGLLEAMYESPEMFDEGLLSFEYVLNRASDEEIDIFLAE